MAGQCCGLACWFGNIGGLIVIILFTQSFISFILWSNSTTTPFFARFLMAMAGCRIIINTALEVTFGGSCSDGEEINLFSDDSYYNQQH